MISSLLSPPKMLRAGLLIATFVLLGRIAGFVREWMLAIQSGVSGATDLAIVILTFPDLMVNLFLGGGLTAALVPAIKRLTPGEGSALCLQVSGSIAAVFAALAILVSLFADTTLRMMAPGVPVDQLLRYVDELRLVTWAVPLTALSGAVVAYLNAHERFMSGAAGTLVFNLSVIAALAWSVPANIIMFVAAGALAGALLRLAMQVVDMRNTWSSPVFTRFFVDRDLLRQYLGSFSFVTILVMLPPVARGVASFGDPGALTLFNFAHKLVELPLGVAVSSIAIVLLPRLAAGFSGGKRAEAHATLVTGVRATLLISLAIAIPAALFADLAVKLAFFRAAFTPEQFSQLAGLAATGFLSLPFQGLVAIYGTAFAADRNVKPLVSVAGFMLIMLLMIAPAAESHFGVGGVMATFVLTYVLGAALLTWQAGRQFGSKAIEDVFRGAWFRLALPATISALVALLGRAVSTDMGAQAVWAALAFAGFVVAALAADKKLLEALRRAVYKE